MLEANLLMVCLYEEELHAFLGANYTGLVTQRTYPSYSVDFCSCLLRLSFDGFKPDVKSDFA